MPSATSPGPRRATELPEPASAPAVSGSRSVPTPRLVLAFAAVYLIWGSTYLAIRFAIETVPPFLMAGTRFVVAGAILYAWFRARGQPAPTLREWRAATIAGGLMLLGGNGLLSWAEQHVPSGIAALLVGTVPLWMVLIARWGPTRERTGPREIGGLALGLLGVALLVAPTPEAVANVGTDARGFVLGAGAVLAGSMLWAAGSMYSRVAPLPPDSLYATALTMLAGGVLLLLAGGARGEAAHLSPTGVSARSALAILYLIAFGSLVAFSAYTWLLRVARPALVGTYAYVNPVVAVLLGWALASEPLGARTALGAAIVVGSVVLVRRGRRRPTAPVVASAGRESTPGGSAASGTGPGAHPYRS